MGEIIADEGAISLANTEEIIGVRGVSVGDGSKKIREDFTHSITDLRVHATDRGHVGGGEIDCRVGIG